MKKNYGPHRAGPNGAKMETSDVKFSSNESKKRPKVRTAGVLTSQRCMDLILCVRNAVFLWVSRRGARFGQSDTRGAKALVPWGFTSKHSRPGSMGWLVRRDRGRDREDGTMGLCGV